MSAATKPMYRKYYQVWREHADKYGPKTALLYQVGGFFEIYDTENLTTGTTQANIREIAELCQLSLTVHALDATTQSLFGGFPEHAVAKFERILVQAGYTVVVVTQRKGRTGAVEERVVDHIASPGCYVESSTRERRLVGCVVESLGDGATALRRVYWAATALDLATGRIWFVEGVDRDRLHQFLCIHPPSELVLWSDGLPAANALTDTLRSLCGATHMRCLPPAAAAVEGATLERHWPNHTKRLTWIHTQPQARRSLAALMDFAADHVPSALRFLDDPEVWIPDGEVRLGNAALEQLGLLSLRGDDKQSLLGLMDQCRSVMGRRAMRSRLMRPVSDVTVIRRRLDRVDAATALLDTEDVAALTERCLRSLYDMSRLWRRVELGTATMGDMACLLRSYEAMALLMTRWPGAPTGGAEYLAWVSSQWNTVVTTELARDCGTSGVPAVALPWQPATRPTVEATFTTGQALRKAAVDLCKEWSAMGRGEPLYLDDAEGGGFRITGTKRRVAAVMTVLRDEGDTTARITPYKTSSLLEAQRLDTLTAQHRTWMNTWTPVWTEAWSTALQELAARGRAAHSALEAWCAELDISWTVARLSREWLWHRPELIDGATEAFVEVENLRHPILERLAIGGAPYVAHTVALSPAPISTPEGVHTSRGLLLYGMNASGKSSLMKALGLSVLLAQCGFPVPAARMRLAPFTALFTRILGNDNLWAGLSSFAVEMTEFREILRFADERSLVLGDELCSGTESLSATALVAAGVETLAGRGAKFVFATHLHELATLPDIAGLSGVRSVHLRVHYDATTDRLVYDRHLAPGSGSALYGLEVCRALDLPTGYLDRATALRKALAGWQAPTPSAYSAGAVVDFCGVCGGSDKLETHHIRPQSDNSVAAIEGFDLNAPGNLVCLCAACHDDHHAGRLIIERWEDTSVGRQLKWHKATARDMGKGVAEQPAEQLVEVEAWAREQKRLRVRIPTIIRMAKHIHGIDVTEKWVRGLRL